MRYPNVPVQHCSSRRQGNHAKIDRFVTGTRSHVGQSAHRSMQRITSLSLLCMTACALPAQYPSSSPLTAATPRVHITESEERRWIGEQGRTRLIELGGDVRAGTTLTIHGINAAPDDVAKLSNAALARGERALTFAYDDNYKRLQTTADDFARHVEAAQSMMPPRTRLRIDAHSMGARAIVVSLDRMQRAGFLTRKAIDLHLIAPLLSGVRSANSSWMMPLLLPFGLSKLVKNAEPSRDLARNSAFQRELEAAHFPSHVHVAITLAEHDRFARKDKTCLKLAERWRASLLVVPGTTHNSVLSAAASPAHPLWSGRAATEEVGPTRHADLRSVPQRLHDLAAASVSPQVLD